MGVHPTGAGKSSFDLVDTDNLFAHLGLRPGSRCLDLGCGGGAYSLALSKRVGSDGKVVAFDLWEAGIESLKRTVEQEGIENIQAEVVDAGAAFPLPDRCIDLCLMATVFHDLVRDGVHTAALGEIRRVLAVDGRLALVEFEKRSGPPGPPIEVRLSPEESTALVAPFGFASRGLNPVGAHTYLSLYALRAGT